jgi:TfoX/Sxy family transcriptional regulator of competence genes
MATTQRTVDYLLEQLAGAGRICARKMFGEYAIYCEATVVGLVCDDEFYLKPTEAGRACLGQVVEASPYPGAKPFFRIGAERWEDAEDMVRLIRTTFRALPPPRPKSAGKSAGNAARKSARKSASKAATEPATRAGKPKRAAPAAPAKATPTAKRKAKPAPVRRRSP